jgi:quercetin dioxygenase-like cupin family protein
MRATSFAVLLVACPAALIAQAGPPPAVQWLVGEQLTAKLQTSRAWVPLLDRSTLSVGRYRLAAGAEDGQQPHDRDEVYFVVAGKARFTAAGETRDVAAGDLVFVAAGAEHRFHDVEHDLDLLVAFSDAVPASGGMRAGPKPTEQTPYDEHSARGATRIFYWFGPDSAGQVNIDYGRPRWQAAYQKFLDQPSGKRWRLGENFWTTLDTNMALQLSGVDVPIGSYYCVLHNDGERGLSLLLVDPAEVRRRRLDAYEADKTTGGIVVPLRREPTDVAAGRLAIEFAVDRDARDRGRLEVSFGKNRLMADVVMHPK